MNANRIKLLLMSAAVVALVCMLSLQPLAETYVESLVAATALPLEDSAIIAEPLTLEATPDLLENPVVIESKVAVQSLGERGDAMFFESEALFGTPFSRKVVMP